MNILLHICCAPCAIYPLEALRSSGFRVTGLFFNHNIHPYQEYRRRLEAAELGYEAFTSSLLYSRYQRHDVIREEGERAAAKFGVRFHYQDFRPGWRRGIDVSRELGLYRQQYCGCIYSEQDRYRPKTGSSRGNAG